eukprot:2192970-Amphidinium_carterae.1
MVDVVESSCVLEVTVMVGNRTSNDVWQVSDVYRAQERRCMMISIHCTFGKLTSVLPNMVEGNISLQADGDFTDFGLHIPAALLPPLQACTLAGCGSGSCKPLHRKALKILSKPRRSTIGLAGSCKPMHVQAHVDKMQVVLDSLGDATVTGSGIAARYLEQDLSTKRRSNLVASDARQLRWGRAASCCMLRLLLS